MGIWGSLATTFSSSGGGAAVLAALEGEDGVVQSVGHRRCVSLGSIPLAAPASAGPET